MVKLSKILIGISLLFLGSSIYSQTLYTTDIDISTSLTLKGRTFVGSSVGDSVATTDYARASYLPIRKYGNDMWSWDNDSLLFKPYSTQQSFSSFDLSSTTPTLTTRLNLNSRLVATGVYKGSTLDDSSYTTKKHVKSRLFGTSTSQQVMCNSGSTSVFGFGLVSTYFQPFRPIAGTGGNDFFLKTSGTTMNPTYSFYAHQNMGMAKPENEDDAFGFYYWGNPIMMIKHDSVIFYKPTNITSSGGGGDVHISGTPVAGQMAQWVSPDSITGVSADSVFNSDSTNINKLVVNEDLYLYTEAAKSDTAVLFITPDRKIIVGDSVGASFGLVMPLPSIHDYMKDLKNGEGAYYYMNSKGEITKVYGIKSYHGLEQLQASDEFNKRWILGLTEENDQLKSQLEDLKERVSIIEQLLLKNQLKCE